jgi:hypothetical protein
VNKLSFVAAAALLTACSPELQLVSPAPPTRVVTVSHDARTVEVSEGVAVAIDCRREGSPCKDVRATTDQPAVARVFPAHIAQVHRGYYEQTNVASLALVGIRPGQTRLHVVAEGHVSEYVVTVLPAK